MGRLADGEVLKDHREPEANFFEQKADGIVDAIDREMSRALGVSKLSSQEKLALGCRILADEGHARTLAGQITVRAESAGAFWTTKLGCGFGETTVNELLLVDQEMKTVQGEGMANPAVRFHLWVYRARPEINCIVHTHPLYSAALSMVGQPLVVAHMDTTMFHEDCAWLENWPGVPLANEEGQLISESLGAKRSILLAHHGLLTTGKTLEQAIYLAVLLEQSAHLQVLAQSIGTIRPVLPALAREAHDFLSKDSVINATFECWARAAARKYPEALSTETHYSGVDGGADSATNAKTSEVRL
jgi:L-fuculose-phosphate aldolase